MFCPGLREKRRLGRAAESYMMAGKLVPDEIVLEMVYERLQQPDCVPVALFDGFPRMLPRPSADQMLEQVAAPGGRGPRASRR